MHYLVGEKDRFSLRDARYPIDFRLVRTSLAELDGVNCIKPHKYVAHIHIHTRQKKKIKTKARVSSIHLHIGRITDLEATERQVSGSDKVLSTRQTGQRRATQTAVPYVPKRFSVHHHCRIGEHPFQIQLIVEILI